MDALITTLLIVVLFVLLGSGVWIGLALFGVAWFGMELFSSRPAGDAMAVTVWGSASSWTLTALPLFVWMGEILFRTRLSEDMFRGLAPWLERLPGRLLHTNIIGCTIFAAVSGSSAATCATIGKMTLPELKARGYPEGHYDRHAGGRRDTGAAHPAVDHHDRLWGQRKRVDRPAVHCRRVPRRAPRIALLGLHHRLGLAASGRHPGRHRANHGAAETARVAPSASGRAADRRGAGFDLRRRGDGDRSGGIRRRRLARNFCSPGLAQSANLCRQSDGRDEALLHDRADPGGRVVPDSGDGLHRTAASPRGMDRQPAPLRIRAYHRRSCFSISCSAAFSTAFRWSC